MRAPSPSWDTLRSGLVIFALFIIARSCVRTVYTWLRPVKQLNRSQPAGLLPLQSRQPILAMNDEKSREGFTADKMKNKHLVRFGGDNESGSTRTKLSIDPSWRSDASGVMPRQFVSHLPPAPPLTPPELSNTVFTFEEGPHSQHSFIHQPNPDYTSASASTAVSQSSTSPSTPRRRSYTKILPIGGGSSGPELADLVFSPSSYPPTSPLLPPPPPSTSGPAEADGLMRREVDVKGEIISALDGEGAGWTRHTRVYGGGPCLACAASGGHHGGGFYGATVPPEEMR